MSSIIQSSSSSSSNPSKSSPTHHTKSEQYINHSSNQQQQQDYEENNKTPQDPPNLPTQVLGKDAYPNNHAYSPDSSPDRRSTFLLRRNQLLNHQNNNRTQHSVDHNVISSPPSFRPKRFKSTNTEEDENSNLFFISEPSLSDTSSFIQQLPQRHHHTESSENLCLYRSPGYAVGDVHLKKSSSNTSLSSLGSPSTAARKEAMRNMNRRQHHQFHYFPSRNHVGAAAATATAGGLPETLLGPMEFSDNASVSESKDTLNSNLNHLQNNNINRNGRNDDDDDDRESGINSSSYNHDRITPPLDFNGVDSSSLLMLQNNTQKILLKPRLYSTRGNENDDDKHQDPEQDLYTYGNTNDEQSSHHENDKSIELKSPLSEGLSETDSGSVSLSFSSPAPPTSTSQNNRHNDNGTKDNTDNDNHKKPATPSSVDKSINTVEEFISPESLRYLTAAESNDSDNGSDCSSINNNSNGSNNSDISFDDSSSDQAEIDIQMNEKSPESPEKKLINCVSKTLGIDTDIQTMVDMHFLNKATSPTTEQNNDEKMDLKEKLATLAVLSPNASQHSVLSPKSPPALGSVEVRSPTPIISNETSSLEVQTRMIQSPTAGIAITTDDDNDSITPKRKTSTSKSTSPNNRSPNNRKYRSDDNIATEADDEGIPRQQRIRIYSDGKKAPKHRRIKSGDDAAATLLTGSADWIGMEMDQLPLPEKLKNLDEDDDDDTESEQITKPESWLMKRRNANAAGQVQTSESDMSKKTDRDALSSSTKTLKARGDGGGNDSLMPIQPILRNPMPVEEFSKYAIGSEDIETGTVSPSRFSKSSQKHFSHVPKEEFESTEVDENESSKAGKGYNMTRQSSFADDSVCSAGSHGSASVFSWISNKISLLSHRDDGILSSGKIDEYFGGIDSSFHRESQRHSPIHEDVTPTSMSTPGTSLVGQGNDIHEPQMKKVSIHETVRESPMLSLDKYSEYPFQPILDRNDSKLPTFTCPRCKTEQREFFTVSTVPKSFSLEIPAGFMITYFFSLFTFGLEEGWPSLDCVYFAVMTLTTTGLGDYVPTTDSAKIVVSIFIYFGVACFGLLLGSLHASSLDEASKKKAEENMINNCIKCSHEQNNSNSTSGRKSSLIQGLSSPRRRSIRRNVMNIGANGEASEEASLLHPRSLSPVNSMSRLHTIDERPAQNDFYEQNLDSVGSGLSYGPDATLEVLGRQSHTKHYSFDTSEQNIFDPGYDRKGSFSKTDDAHRSRDFSHSDASTNASIMSDTSDDNLFTPVSKIKALKYVFLALKQAFTNTLFIIGIGFIGFYHFETMSAVDAFYITTSLLTTVGYGDIVPITPLGKLFATVYGAVAFIVLLYNISMISMIPLELRKRRIEHRVLTQFGDDLDEAALRELVSGPLVKRMADNRPGTTDQCTREMFALAMLVRLGRITEQDVRTTFAAFRRLDKDNDGVVTSRQAFISDIERTRKGTRFMPRDVGNLMPRSRSSLSDFTENSTLLHPLADRNNRSYKTVESNDEKIAAPQNTSFRSRQLSAESMWSAMTEDPAWEDNPHNRDRQLYVP